MAVSQAQLTPDHLNSDCGIVPRALKELFEAAAAKRAEGLVVRISMSFLQVISDPEAAAGQGWLTLDRHRFTWRASQTCYATQSTRRRAMSS